MIAFVTTQIILFIITNVIKKNRTQSKINEGPKTNNLKKTDSELINALDSCIVSNKIYEIEDPSWKLNILTIFQIKKSDSPIFVDVSVAMMAYLINKKLETIFLHRGWYIKTHPELFNESTERKTGNTDVPKK